MPKFKLLVRTLLIAFLILVVTFIVIFIFEPRGTISSSKNLSEPALNVPELTNPELTNPQFSYTNDNTTRNKSFEKNISNIIDSYEINTGVISISVYFRNLNDGEWFVVNEEKNYSPASLLKLYTLVAALKIAENNPEFLNYSIIYAGQYNDFNNLKIRDQLIEGQAYTIDDLLWHMTVDSDNVSHDLILDEVNKIDPTLIDQIKNDFQLNKDHLTKAYINVIPIAIIFEKLYKAEYLTQEYSKKALSLLVESSFDVGISAPVNPNTPVANKFGLRRHDLTEIYDLHDCGIIYEPKNPYVFCILTRGRSMQMQEKIIQSISKKVYEEMK